VVAVIGGQLEKAAGSPSLRFASMLSLALAVFGSTSGIKALMSALNIAHKRPETRSFVRRNLIAIALGLGGILAVVLAVGVVVFLPTALSILRVHADTAEMVNLVRWPAMFLLVMAGLAVLYRVAPVDPPHRILAGTAIATALWMVSSFLLSLYVDRVANYSGLYGAFGGVMIVILWFYVSSFVMMLGAVINEELDEARWQRGSAEALPRPTPAPYSHAV
jgi:membrane protein